MVQFPVESVEEFGNVRRNNVFKRATSIQLVLLVCLFRKIAVFVKSFIDYSCKVDGL